MPPLGHLVMPDDPNVFTYKSELEDFENVELSLLVFVEREHVHVRKERPQKHDGTSRPRLPVHSLVRHPLNTEN